MKKEQHKHQAIESVHSLAQSLKALSEKRNELDFEDFLKENILPVLLKDEEVYGTSIWEQMDIVKIVHIDSILRKRGNSMKESIRKMNVDAICWLLEHTSMVVKLLKHSTCKKDFPSSEQDYNFCVRCLQKDIDELQEWLNDDIFERIQSYEYEIKNPKILS